MVLICLFGLCYGAGAPGAPWTAEETEIIYKKVMFLYFEHKKNNNIKEMKKYGYDSKDYTPDTNFPSAAKVISLYYFPKLSSEVYLRLSIRKSTHQKFKAIPKLFDKAKHFKIFAIFLGKIKPE